MNDQSRYVTMNQNPDNTERASCRKSDDGVYELVVQTDTAEMGFGNFSRAEAEAMADALRAAPPGFLSALEAHFRRKQAAERSARIGRLRRMHRDV